jgi:hypothetical protein
MDTGRGDFALISEQRYKELTKDHAKSRSFAVGEIVELKGSRFKVTAIEKRGRLKLKLLHDDKG